MKTDFDRMNEDEECVLRLRIELMFNMSGFFRRQEQIN